ncbi:hypothetical protein DBR17_00410 [Sphingomonas sp. HMWF008]|nr:hypothetical protein DBR17_00410 [Sphingomonas sp. HMWF008]
MTLSGVWQNEYGSIMDLSVYGGGLVFGTYSSSTGSTGEYRVIGFQQNANPTTTAGQAVALAIAWHSIAGGKGDPSWNWSSGLSGQLSLQNGKESLVLAHAMVASSAFPGLCAAGTYIDKLIYARVSDTSREANEKPLQTAAVADPMAGTWATADGATVLTLRVYPYTGNLFGWVSGSLSNGGTVCQIEGVTDINAAASGLTLQSTGLTAIQNLQNGPAIAFAGCLDLRTGQLTLLKLASLSTAPDATYVQTTVDQLSFRRVAADHNGK